jgi:CheY-like chemotaxis protein
MGKRHKILVLDDDPDFLELCQELLATLPSEPEVKAATSGSHAIAVLDSDPQSLLMTDLKMPGMDGFQVLSIVKRRHPDLKTIVMTGEADSEFRDRAYAIGIDLFVEKPKTPSEIKQFVDCVESLLEREQLGGFRGVQSKSLSDIVQMESMSMASTTLKITNGPLIGKIWLDGGDLVDAEVGSETGEDAFKRIMSWKSGVFENLPVDSSRERAIFSSIQGLLLDSAQTLDEIAAGEVPGSGGEKADTGSRLSHLAKQGGVDFLVTASLTKKRKFDHFACEDPELIAKWARETFNRFASMGEMLKAGKLNHVAAMGPQRNAGLAANGEDVICIGMSPKLKAKEVIETTKKVVVQWDS